MVIPSLSPFLQILIMIYLSLILGLIYLLALMQIHLPLIILLTEPFIIFI
jgi:hypothetical protein